MATTERDDTTVASTLRAYRYCLNPTQAQEAALAQHAGAARWAYNHALAAKFEALARRQLQIDELVTVGIPEPQARREATVKVPSKPVIQKTWNRFKGDERAGLDGTCPWWRTVSTYAFQSAFIDVDTAWKNWRDSLTGKRAGRRVCAPRFKKKGRSLDSFRIHHDVKNPTIRLDGYRRITVPRLGSLRIHDTAKPLVRAITRGAVIQSITISRRGHRWYASILTKAPAEQATPTRAQRAAGTVGVDLGVHHLAALSTGEIINNPRHLHRATKKLTKAQRAFARTQKGSNRRAKAAARLGRLHHQVAEHRISHLHGITKRLATGFETVAVEDLNVAGMTRSAVGTFDAPGRNVRAKAGLNRAILDTSPAEFRRQLDYKTRWYGSELAVRDRWFPSSKTCSACGAVKAKLLLSERVFRCPCGQQLDRDVNAAINLACGAVEADRSSLAEGDLKRPVEGMSVLQFLGAAGVAQRSGKALVVTSGRQRPGHPSKTCTTAGKARGQEVSGPRARG